MGIPDTERVVQDHFLRIHRAAMILSGNPWDADDLTQETFLVFARDRHRYAGRSSVYTWLYGILLNLERRERRRRGTQLRKLLAWRDDGPGSGSSVPPADHKAEFDEWKRSLWAVVAELPDGQRQALVLRFSEGLRYEEIATVMGCPLGTVKSRIFHGLMALRERWPQLDASRFFTSSE